MPPSPVYKGVEEAGGPALYGAPWRCPTPSGSRIPPSLVGLGEKEGGEREEGKGGAVPLPSPIRTRPRGGYHARKCVRSRSGTHGKISQHNSKNINKSYKHHNTSQGPRGLEYKCSIIDESAEATISEYRHKLNKFALRRLAQTGIQIERGAGLLPGILLTTPGRCQRAARSRGTSGVVGVVVDGGVWLLNSSIWL